MLTFIRTFNEAPPILTGFQVTLKPAVSLFLVYLGSLSYWMMHVCVYPGNCTAPQSCHIALVVMKKA